MITVLKKNSWRAKRKQGRLRCHSGRHRFDISASLAIFQTRFLQSASKSILVFSFLLFAFCVPAPVRTQTHFARVEKTWQWQFPRDHGQHAKFQTEWWYFTGNLKAENGHRFGYELTFFRQAFLPMLSARPSSWAFRDVYIAHFAITEVEKENFYYDQKISRGALNLAGADSAALAVHLGDWFARQETATPSAGVGKIQLRALSTFGKIDFVLTPMQPPVFHGVKGSLPNSDLPGDAAYYYSLPNLQTEGILKLNDDAFYLRGTSWMDHEFFTPVVDIKSVHWDWLSLHLSDSTEVMLAQLHRGSGAEVLHSTGTFIQRNGTAQTLSSREIGLEPQAWWTSPVSGGKYPLAWKIKFLDYELQLSTPVKNQELDTRRTTGNFYWEGYVEASGKKGGQTVRGEGYLEMTGYENPPKAKSAQ